MSTLSQLRYVTAVILGQHRSFVATAWHDVEAWKRRNKHRIISLFGSITLLSGLGNVFYYLIPRKRVTVHFVRNIITCLLDLFSQTHTIFTQHWFFIYIKKLPEPYSFMLILPTDDNLVIQKLSRISFEVLSFLIQKLSRNSFEVLSFHFLGSILWLCT